MKTILKISIIFLISIQNAFSLDKIAYLDIDFILSNSNKGKSIIKILDEKNKVNISKLKEKEKILKKLESDIEKKKNIISKEELNIQIENLKKKIIIFRDEKEKLVNNFNSLKKDEISKLMKEINPIIINYVKENSISVVLNKKNILIGQASYDITNDLLDLVNIKLK